MIAQPTLPASPASTPSWARSGWPPPSPRLRAPGMTIGRIPMHIRNNLMTSILIPRDAVPLEIPNRFHASGIGAAQATGDRKQPARATPRRYRSSIEQRNEDPNVKRWLLIAAITCGAALFGAYPASAHSELVSSDPPADATLAVAPIGVGLVFNQDIKTSFATMSLIGPDEEQWAQGPATVEGPNVSVPVKGGLPNGQYTVGYRVTSADGHPITGSYTFSVAGTATDIETEPSSGTAPSGSASSTSPSSSAPTTTQAYDPNNPSASEDRPPMQNTMMLLSIVGITVLALAAIALTLVIRGKNRR